MATNLPPIPSDDEAERIVVGSCLLSADALAQVESILQPAHFFSHQYAAIYGAMLKLARKGQPVEWQSVAAALPGADMAALADLTHDTPTATHAAHYARIVEQMAVRRQLIQASNRIAQLAYNTAADFETVVQGSVEALNGAMPQATDDAILYWEESLGRFLAMQQEREAHKDRPQFDLPWPTLAEWVSPLQAGMLAVVAAQDGVGKTSFAEVLAEHWARERGFRVAFFHFELSHGLMLDRRSARRTRTPIRAIQTGLLNDQQHAAIDEMSRWPGAVHYVHCPGWPMSRVAAIARQLVRGGKADIVVVDYLGKSDISGYKGDQNTAQRRGADVETLKNLAEREGIPILLMSQLSREAAHQPRKSRHTIRDSGEVSEKSNLVMLLDRDILDEGMDFSEYGYGPLVYNEGQYSPVISVVVDKQTIGPTGEGKLFMLPTFDIVELPRPSFNERVAARQKARGEDF